jgi:hypothetical protein
MHDTYQRRQTMNDREILQLVARLENDRKAWHERGRSTVEYAGDARATELDWTATKVDETKGAQS